MILASTKSQYGISDLRKHDIGDVFPEWHASFSCAPRYQHARPEHGVSRALCDRTDKFGNERGVVLKIWMHHDHDVGARRQRLAIARFLVPTVPAVFWMHDRFDTQRARMCRGVIG